MFKNWRYLVVVLMVAATAQASEIVALKRDSGLDTGGGIDARFTSATVEQVTVGDSGVYSAGNSRWSNGGIAAVVGNSDVLLKFDLTTVSQLIGGYINLAELRVYHTGGNTWGTGLYRITTHDWLEGTVEYAAYPGAAGGMSYAHPVGYNTGPNQDASGGTTPPLQTWGVTSDSFFSALGDCDMSRGKKNGGGGTGYTVWDVTDIVQSWVDGANNYGLYLDNSNYSINLSEAGTAENPVLFIDYIPAAPPTDITDLATATVDWFMVELTWTAPSDEGGPGGGAYEYDIRYSNAPIDAGNWDSATQCSGEPTPAAPSTAESFDVTGLDTNTLYYFAIKSGDAGGLWSNLSNVVAATTDVLDPISPRAVDDLSAVDVKPNRVTLSWTATGDDLELTPADFELFAAAMSGPNQTPGNSYGDFDQDGDVDLFDFSAFAKLFSRLYGGGDSGTASVYDLRYDTVPIDEGNFSGATPVTGLSAPQPPGSAEQVIVSGLLPSTQYYFALRVGDEVPNLSGLSNVVSATTLAEDLAAPDAITDLTVTATHIHTAYLSWTSPADNGSAGLGGYDVRYSTSLIDDGNFAAATQCDGEPIPTAPGLVENFVVTGLDAETEYYFAVKSFDLAEPPNVSDLSNVPSATTLPPVAAVTVQNPWIVNDRVADCRTITTIAETFVNSYQPDGVTPPGSDQDRAINCYNNYKRRVYHWAVQPPDLYDTVTVVNLFGTVLCGRHAAHNCTILSNVPELGHRQIGLPGHWIYEAQYDGAWHAFCTMTTMYTYNRANPPAITSCAEYDADETLMTLAVAEGRACPGFLLCGDTPEWYATAMHSWWDGGSGVAATDHSMDMDIPVGMAVDRTWETWPDQHFPPLTGDPPYHHESQHDWKDGINYPYWKPYALYGWAGKSVTYRRYANGTVVLAPDFRSAGYQASLEDSSNIATYDDDAQTPDLHLAAVGSAYVVFRIDCPFYLTDAWIDGTFYRNDTGDANRILFSDNGTSWTPVWTNDATGSTQLNQFSLRNAVYELFGEYWIKIELDADDAITDAGLTDLVITTVFQHNKGAMAYLDKGLNNITVTLDNPQDLVSGVAFKVTYDWKEYDGADWTIDQSIEQYITASPTNFAITTGGSEVPRTEYIKLEVTAPPIPDGSPPDPITDLAALNPDSTTIDLTWTAPGDDGDQGRATRYDLRYSTTPITDENWDGATEVDGEPAPQDAGNTEYFTVTDLASSTLYYLAVKTYDEGNNVSPLSNVVFETTNPPDVTAPAAITTLMAVTGTESGSVDLIWEAPGDDGTTGTAAGYDVRYSTLPITEGNWGSATQADGEPVPQPAGSVDWFTLTGLDWGQLYYFAIKTSDEVPNESDLSNVASVQAASLGEITLQYGLNGFSSTRDSYTEAGAPDNNRGTTEWMRICGYADSAPTNRQRGIIWFDLSSIPPGTTITAATLWLYSYNPPQVKGTTGFYGAYRLTTDWTESASTWNSPWITPGGDFEATPDATAPKQSAAQAPCWYSFDVTTRAQQWIDDASGNYGWLIKCTDELLHNQDEFYQRDTSNGQYRPKLVLSDQ